jgi:hypothetical protein
MPMSSRIALQPNGKLVLRGYFQFKTGEQRELVRLNSDGSLDNDERFLYASPGPNGIGLDTERAIRAISKSNK